MSLTKEGAAKKLQDVLVELHKEGWDLCVTGHGVAYMLGPDFETFAPESPRRLLTEDNDPIKVTEGREAWDPQKSGYTAEDYKADKARRESS